MSTWINLSLLFVFQFHNLIHDTCGIKQWRHVILAAPTVARESAIVPSASATLEVLSLQPGGRHLPSTLHRSCPFNSRRKSRLTPFAVFPSKAQISHLNNQRRAHSYCTPISHPSPAIAPQPFPLVPSESQIAYKEAEAVRLTVQKIRRKNQLQAQLGRDIHIRYARDILIPRRVAQILRYLLQHDPTITDPKTPLETFDPKIARNNKMRKQGEK